MQGQAKLASIQSRIWGPYRYASSTTFICIRFQLPGIHSLCPIQPPHQTAAAGPAPAFIYLMHMRSCLALNKVPACMHRARGSEACLDSAIPGLPSAPAGQTDASKALHPCFLTEPRTASPSLSRRHQLTAGPDCCVPRTCHSRAAHATRVLTSSASLCAR